MIEINGKNVSGININNKEVIRVQDAITLDVMWVKREPTSDYFYIQNATNDTCTVTLKVGSQGTVPQGSYAASAEYSRDGNNWSTIQLVQNETLSLSANEKVYFRNDSGYFSYFKDSVNYYYIKFDSDKLINIGGNLKTLVDYTNINTTLPNGSYNKMFYLSKNINDASNLVIDDVSDYCCYEMFEQYNSGTTGLISAPILTATTLAKGCYDAMFKNCKNLTTAPALPATTLAEHCYDEMFSYCRNLTTAPTLPALEIKHSSYKQMFYACSSLVNPPVMSATSLNVSSCNEMFRGCTSLTTSPVLLSPTLKLNCYKQMFYGCSSLTSVTSYADNITRQNYGDYTTRWLENASSTGTFHNLGSGTYPSSSGGIPSGWTEVHS